MTLLSAICALLACCSLALGQDRHRKAVVGTNATYRLPTARWSGAVLLILSLGTGVLGEGSSFGVLLWFLLVALASMITAATLCWQPQALRTLARSLAAIERRRSPP